MRINESIWGTESEWLTAPTTYFSPLGKVANFGENKYSLIDAINNNKLTFDVPISDKSLSWCGMGTESNYAHCKLFNNNGDELPYEQAEIVNFFMYCLDGQQVVTEQNCSMGNDYKACLWNGYDPGQTFGNFNVNKFIAPFTDFNIKKIVWRVLVECYSSVSSNTSQTFDFNDYKNNQMSSYPIITKIYAIPYIERSDSPISRTQINFISGTHYCLAPAIFNRYNVYSSDPSALYANYGIYSGDRAVKLILFGSDVQNTNPTYVVSVGNCKRKTTSPRKTYQDDNLNDVLESALKTIACFGFYFVLDGENHINDNLDSEYIYMGVIPNDGITHGEYTHGAANRDNPNWTMTNTKTSNYDYKKQPTDRTTIFGSNTLYNTFIQYYAMSPAQLNNLCNVVYTYINSVDTSTEDINKAITKTFYTNNPLDVIVSLKKLPFNIVDYFGISSTSVPVKLGNLANAAATGYKLNGQYTVVNFGSYTVEPAFGNSFLDYSPYTYAELIIPFCGSTRIDAALFMGKTLNLKMVVDLYTGACTCYILVNNLCIDSVSGNCAIDIPVTGIQSADFQNSVQNAITNVKNARLQIKSYERKGNIAMGAIWNGSTSGQLGNTISNIGSSLSAFRNIPSAVTSAESTRVKNDFDLQKANYDLEHVQTPFNSVGSQSAANSYVEEMQARIIIYRPILSDDYDAGVYASTVGHACMKEGTVSAFSGLTVGSINVSGINASEQEKQLIQSAFASGVYL